MDPKEEKRRRFVDRYGELPPEPAFRGDARE